VSRQLRIADRTIGPDAPVLVIAELGVNHDGEPATALELVDAAAAAGADAVKLQWFRARDLMGRAARPADYQRAAGETDPVAMLERLTLDDEAMLAVAERARAAGLAVIVSVFSADHVERVAAGPWDAFKVASPDLVHRPLLDALAAHARLDRPMLVSTGAATPEEVERTVGWLAGVPIVLLQCVSAYPCPMSSAALGGIPVIAERFGRPADPADPPRPVGYSDHTTESDTGALAVAAGARMIEKHLTLDRSRPGPDHAASADPGGFAAYVRAIRRAESMLGPRAKAVLPVEHDVRSASRQSITARRDLAAGSTLRAEDLTIKRPGTGLGPHLLASLPGRVLARDVRGDEPLVPRDLAPVAPCESPIAAAMAAPAV